MEDFLAHLSADVPIFDAPPVLAPSFELDNGFMGEQADQLYPPDLAGRPDAPQPSSDDYFEVDEPDAKPKPDLAPPAPSPPPPAPKPEPEPAVAPRSPPDSQRRRLRPLALSVVSDAWSAGRHPAEFIAAARRRLPTATPGEEDSAMPSVAPVPDDQPVAWHLPDPSEGALLDALFVKLINFEATSTRLMSYLSHAVVTGAVSQRAALSTCLKWIDTTPDISDRVMQSLSQMLAAVIPHYRFSSSPDLTAEVNDFLSAFAVVVKSTAQTPSLAHHLVAVLQHDRVIALLRACARRVPSIWPQLNTHIADLQSPSPGATDQPPTFASQSAFTVAPELKELVERLRKGLCVGITPLESIAYSIGNLAVPASDASQPIALQTAFAVTLQVFETEVATALRDLWSQREGQGGDLPLLVALEKATKPDPNPTQQHHPSAPKYGFQKKVQACEAIVRFLAERSSEPGASEKWKGLWGGKERLKRIIRDAIPQVKNEIRSETGALIVSMAVTCCAGMCLGPALRIHDANDGVDVLDPIEASQQEAQSEEVEETMGELIAFAVGSLEEAALAEETPLWRSFGLWLLLLMSRSGSMLRASGCDHVRAARVLRAWGGMPTGTPGTHTSQSSSHKHSSQGGAGHQHSQASSSSWAMQEGVSMFATSSSYAIIDVSDVSGSDDTIRALCEDLVQ